MERYFIFDKFNTWLDWRSVLTKKSITPSDVKTNYVSIDGMSGSLDLSEALTGEVVYKDRTISASFWTDEGSFTERAALLKRIVAALHGKKIKIIEPDDPAHYFYGRVAVKSVNNILPYAEYTLEATCEPWRYAMEETYRYIAVDSALPTNLVIRNNGVKTVCPVITVTGTVNIIYDGATTTLTDGSYKVSDIKLRQGVNVIGVSGNGSASFAYREADI